MLSGKQKRYLRSLGNRLPSTFQIGKDGLSYNLKESIFDYLIANELIKISILKTCELSLNEIEVELCAYCSCELVQEIGKTIILYKRSKDNKIILP